MKKHLILLTLFAATWLQPAPLLASAPHIGGTDYTEATQRSAAVLEQIIKVNNYWQAHNTPYVRSFWDHAAYHTGDM